MGAVGVGLWAAVGGGYAWQLLDDGGGGSVDLNVWAQYGVLGVIASMLIWFARGAHQRERDRADRMETENRRLIDLDRERERADKMEAENRRLNDLILERIIPSLIAATHAAEESAELLNAIQREREREREYNRRPRGGGD